VTNSVVTIEELEARLLAAGRVLTDPERVVAEQRLGEVVDLLELHLNRVFGPRAILGERHVVSGRGRLVLHKGPVISVERILVDGAETTSPTLLAAWDLADWPPSSVLTVDYTAGLAAPPTVKGIVLDAVTAATLAGAKVAAGVVTSYTVEGTSITYGSASSSSANAEGVGRVPVADIRSVRRLRRRVLLT